MSEESAELGPIKDALTELSTSVSTAGPAVQITEAERLKKRRKLRTDLWTAIWEASDLISTTDIEAYCKRVISEIDSDEP